MNCLSSEIIWCFTLWWNSYYLTGECSPNFFDLIGKDPDAGKDWGQEGKGATEDEMVGWHHWLDGHELTKLREIVKDKEAWHAAVHGVAKSWTWVSDWIATTNNQQNHLLKTQIPTLGHLKLLCHWAVQGLMFLGSMYSVLDLITSFLCNTCQIVCTFFQESNRKLPNFSLTFYFCFRAFRSVTFCTSFYSFTSCAATCMSLSFFRLLMPLCCTSRSFSTPHPQYFFRWSISELQLSFVCIFLWLNVYGHYHKNSYSITISTPSLGRKTSAAFLILLACLMAVQPNEEGAPPTTRLFILLGKPYIVERPKSAKKKKKKKIASAFLCFTWINAKSFILKLFPLPLFCLPVFLWMNE